MRVFCCYSKSDFLKPLHWWQRMATTSAVRMPKAFSPGDDFQLWCRRFEAYARSVRLPQEQQCDALLALLDDAAFRAFDLLGLSEETSRDYKLLVEALTKRFSSSTGQQEVKWLLTHRTQEPGENLDAFADALVHLANRAYPKLEPGLRADIVKDRFVEGVSSEYVQDALLRSPPDTLDEARDAARRAEAAQAARRRLRSRRTAEVSSMSMADTTDGIVTLPQHSEIAAVSANRDREDQLAEAIRRNTEVLEKLMSQLPRNTPDSSSFSQPRRHRRPASGSLPTCWTCGQPGHFRRDCPAGNERRPVPWGEHRPRSQ